MCLVVCVEMAVVWAITGAYWYWAVSAIIVSGSLLAVNAYIAYRGTSMPDEPDQGKPPRRP
jgi:hypothetical protein